MYKSFQEILKEKIEDNKQSVTPAINVPKSNHNNIYYKDDIMAAQMRIALARDLYQKEQALRHKKNI